jgi:hypothetical protein
MLETSLAHKMWLVERDQKMQHIALKKIELERIREEREIFDKMERKKKLEESVVLEIIKNKQMDNS